MHLICWSVEVVPDKVWMARLAFQVENNVTKESVLSELLTNKRKDPLIVPLCVPVCRCVSFPPLSFISNLC